MIATCLGGSLGQNGQVISPGVLGFSPTASNDLGGMYSTEPKEFFLHRLAVEPLCIQSQKKVCKTHDTLKCACQALEDRDSYCFVHQVSQHDVSAHNLRKCAFHVCEVQGFISSHFSTLQVLDHWTSRQKSQIMIQASALSFLKLG